MWLCERSRSIQSLALRGLCDNAIPRRHLKHKVLALLKRCSLCQQVVYSTDCTFTVLSHAQNYTRFLLKLVSALSLDFKA